MTTSNEIPMPEAGQPVESGTEGFGAILTYPKHEEIRDALYKQVKEDCEKYSGDSAWGTPRHVVGQKYSNAFCKSIPQWNDFITWIDGLALEVSLHLNQSTATGAPYDIQAIHLYEYWGLLYKKGTETKPHNHFPYSLSFGYYINVPDGSPPLIMGGNEMYPKEGEVILFPSSIVHSVPLSDVDDRVMIAGNFAYQPSRFEENHSDPAGQTQETTSNMPPNMQAVAMKMRKGGMDPGTIPSDIRNQIPPEILKEMAASTKGVPQNKFKGSRPGLDAMKSFFGDPTQRKGPVAYTQKKKKKGFTDL